MNPFFSTCKKHSPVYFFSVVCFFLLIIPACAHRRAPDNDALNRKWFGKPFSAIVDKLGTPHRSTLHPDGEKQYMYVYREKPLYNDIFRGEFLNDMTTIRIQEELAREEQSKCLLEVFVINNKVVGLNAPGVGCRDIRERLGE